MKNCITTVCIVNVIYMVEMRGEQSQQKTWQYKSSMKTHFNLKGTLFKNAVFIFAVFL